MDSCVFGSFSVTTFIDLYDSHFRTWYDTIKLYEIAFNKETNKQEIITQSNNISDFKRKTNKSYLFGMMYVYDNTNTRAYFADSIGIDDGYKEKKKAHHYEVDITDGIMTIFTTDKNHLHVDVYMSLSSMVLNNFQTLLPNKELTFDIREVYWNKFGNAEGYGSRNKINGMIDIGK